MVNNKIIRAGKIAKTLIKIHKITSPINIIELIKKYAILEIEYEIPFEFDGLCFFKSGKPNVIINGNISEARQKFTMAHELGHILIPGHKNIIACNMDNQEIDSEEDYNEQHYLYLSKEREANAFAAELLMPENWIKKEIKNLNSFKEMFSRISKLTQLSIQAITIRVIPFMKPGYIVFIKYNNSDEIIKFISPSTNLYQFGIESSKLDTSRLEKEKLESIAQKVEKFEYNNYSIEAYDVYEDLNISPEKNTINASSTEILQDYLEDNYEPDTAKKLFFKINGIIANMNSKNAVKNMTEEEYYLNVNKCFRSRRGDIIDITKSKSFSEYISKRYFELKNK